MLTQKKIERAQFLTWNIFLCTENLRDTIDRLESFLDEADELLNTDVDEAVGLSDSKDDATAVQQESAEPELCGWPV